jgi:TRAP transporter TAXI family solute receptor
MLGRRALAMSVMATGAAAEAPVALSLATATPGGGFPAFGAAFVAALAGVDAGLAVTPRNTAGSTENVRLLAEGAVDLGLVQGETAYAALAAGQGVTVLTAMCSAPSLFALSASSTAESFEMLRGRRIAWGARGSGFVILARQAMGGIGLDIERDFDAVFLERAGDGPAMVREERVAALWGGGIGWPGFRTLAEGPGGVRFLGPSPAERARILAAAPMLRAMALPAGSYAGQTAPIETIGTWSMVLARPGLAEAVGYRLAAALDRARPELARLLPAAAETTPANTLVAAPGPAAIHPGVRRYLGERGLIAG